MTILRFLLWLNFIYYLVLQALYFLFFLLSAWQLRQSRRRSNPRELEEIAQSPLTPAVSLIIPAYNEAAIIVKTVQNAFTLNFPRLEVIVINDGSTDSMMAVLREAFRLSLTKMEGASPLLPTQEVMGVYRSASYPNLVVVDKKNGRRADAINAGQNYSTHPLLCIIDADCVLEADTLLHLVRPFLREAEVAAVAGIVRPSNGLRVEQGRIVERRLPRTWLGMNQEVEYMRGFQWARLGLCRLQSMLCISGALMMIKRNVFQTLGGSSPSSITDDFEFTVRLNAHVYDRRQAERAQITFASEAICYTEIPETFRQYASQRNRWERGTLQGLARNGSMFLNLRYGLTGLFGFPFFVFFESLATFVEILGWGLLGLVLLLGVASGWEVLLLLYCAYLLNIFLSLLALLLTETSRVRASNGRDLGKMILAIFLDNLGFHQFHLLVRVVGAGEFIVLGRRDLGLTMDRMAPQNGPS